MDIVLVLIVVGTALWMGFESASFGYEKSDIKGFASLGPVGWFVAGVGLWIVAFPLYLAKRDELRRAGAERRGAAVPVSSSATSRRGRGCFVSFVAGSLALIGVVVGAYLLRDRTPEVAQPLAQAPSAPQPEPSEPPAPQLPGIVDREPDPVRTVPDGRISVGEMLDSLQKAGAGPCKRQSDEDDARGCIVSAADGFPFMVKLQSMDDQLTRDSAVSKVVMMIPARVPEEVQGAAMALVVDSALVADLRGGIGGPQWERYSKALSQKGSRKFKSEHFDGTALVETELVGTTAILTAIHAP